MAHISQSGDSGSSPASQVQVRSKDGRRLGPQDVTFHPKRCNHGPECSEAGSYLRRIDSCITQLKGQGPSRTCNESKEEEVAFRVESSSTGIDPIALTFAPCF